MSHPSPHWRQGSRRAVRPLALAIVIAILGGSPALLSAQNAANEEPVSAQELGELRALVRELQARDARIEAELADVKAQLRQQSTQPTRRDNDEAVVAEPGRGPFVASDPMPQSPSGT